MTTGDFPSIATVWRKMKELQLKQLLPKQQQSSYYWRLLFIIGGCSILLSILLSTSESIILIAIGQRLSFITTTTTKRHRPSFILSYQYGSWSISEAFLVTALLFCHCHLERGTSSILPLPIRASSILPIGASSIFPIGALHFAIRARHFV